LLSAYQHFQVGNPGLLNAVCDTRLQISVDTRSLADFAKVE
jgi:hypothetical protein